MRAPGLYGGRVPRYLSAEWFADVEQAMQASTPAAAGSRLVIQQVVTGTPDGDIAYTFAVDDGAVRITPGEAERADAIITQDYATASQLYRGETTLQDVFMAGRVKIRGNMAALIAGQTALAAAEPLPDAVRAATTF